MGLIDRRLQYLMFLNCILHDSKKIKNKQEIAQNIYLLLGFKADE